jgi:murein DD-endopeptidase MepM/ murein hydrolase activator NlpD
MARYQSTVSGDMTSFIGGKIASAAGMARRESEAQEKDRQSGLNVANSGNLFGKALLSEFGGDLFSRTIGVLNPNQSAAQTDRASNKAQRFAANFPRTDKKDEEVKKSNRDVDRAVDDLLTNDDHIPVKDEKLRDYVTRVFGVGIDSKLTQVDARVSKSVDVLSDIRKVHQGSVNLMIDHNELIAGKLDKILQLYSDQFDFQQSLKDRSEVARSETELERKRDLSTTKRFTGLDTGRGGSMLFGAISDIVGKKLWSKIAEKLGLKVIPPKAANVGIGSLLSRSAKTAFKHTRASTVINEVFRGKKFTKQLVKNPSKAFKGLAKTFVDPNVVRFLETGLGRTNLKKVAAGIKLDAKGKQLAGQDALLNVLRDPNLGVDDALAASTEKFRRKAALDITKNPKAAEAFKNSLMQGQVPGDEIFRANKINKKLASSTGKKATKKLATKSATKAVAKTGKLVPGVGTVIALGEAAYRASQGDMTGAGLSLLSAVPIIGWGVTAIDIARDLGFNPLGLPPPPGESGWQPPEFESGTPMLTKPGVTELHGTEKYLGVDPGSGMTTDHIKNIGDSIVSASAKMAQDLAVSRDVANSIAGLPFTVKRVNYSTGIKTGPVKSRSDTQSIFDVQGDISKFKKEAETAVEDPRQEKANEALDREEKQNSRWLTDPRRHLNFGNGGSSAISANNPLLAQSGDTTIQFHGQQGRDLSGEPGVDFSFGDYRNNYNLFDGTVIETGLLYGKNYGNVVVVRSTDPSCGKQFDALYAHFPDGGIYVKPGDRVTGGAILGKVGFVSVSTPGVPELQPNNAGNMSGWHTSVDFFEPDSATRYANADKIINLVLSSNGLKPKNLLQKLAISPVEEVVPSSTNSIVEYYTGDQSHPNWEPYLHDGGREHEHYGFSSKEERDRAIKVLEAHGIIVNPGGEPGDHTEGSLHYEDRAIDVQFGPHVEQDRFDWIRQLMGTKSRHRFTDDEAGEEEFAQFIRQILIDNGFTGITQDEVGPEHFEKHGTIDSERFNDLSDPFLKKQQETWNIPDYLHKRNIELQNNSMLLDELETEAANRIQIVVLNNTIVNQTNNERKYVNISGGLDMNLFRMAKLAG